MLGAALDEQLFFRTGRGPRTPIVTPRPDEEGYMPIAVLYRQEPESSNLMEEAERFARKIGGVSQHPRWNGVVATPARDGPDTHPLRPHGGAFRCPDSELDEYVEHLILRDFPARERLQHLPDDTEIAAGNYRLHDGETVEEWLYDNGISDTDVYALES